jgi:hypothetical protein
MQSEYAGVVGGSFEPSSDVENFFHQKGVGCNGCITIKVLLRHGGRCDERLVVAAVRVIKADRSTASRDHQEVEEIVGDSRES